MTTSSASADCSHRPPVIIIGGDANALSVVRSLAREGIEVFALNYADAHVLRSRHCTAIETPPPHGVDQWEKTLLSPQLTERLGGAVLLTCSDEAIELMIRSQKELENHYRTEIGEPRVRRRLLDKLETYREAHLADVPHPRFWEIKGPYDLASIEDELDYPIVVKPTIGPKFCQEYGRKFLRATERSELAAQLADVHARGFQVVLMEFIPGSDDQLCSYYTYMDEDGSNLINFTKRVVRRYPTNMGGATHHLTDHVPEAQRLGLRLFRHVGLRGLGNVEFKLDPRDGQLKIIECNARFTAANALVEASGVPLAHFVYRHIIGDPIEPPEDFATGLRMLDPVRDFLAYRELSRTQGYAVGDWLRSVAFKPILPFLSLRDPLPGLVRHQQLIGDMIRARLGKRRS